MNQNICQKQLFLIIFCSCSDYVNSLKYTCMFNRNMIKSVLYSIFIKLLHKLLFKNQF